MSFDLLTNPFAVLRATPRTPPGELPGLAEGTADPAAPAALRTLSIPRTRLPAEIAFLPGVDDAGVARVLDVLGAPHPDPAGLPPLPSAARANVLAHLCSAGVAGPPEWATLVLAQLAPGDAALVAALDADRAVAGLPPVQVAALRAEAETLADRQAAALLLSILADPDPAGRLAGLVGEAAAGPPAAFTRKVAAAWSRHAASLLAGDEEAAEAARATLVREPDRAALGHLVERVGTWARHSAPQRLADARAGLDHAATLRALRRWRGAVLELEDDHPALALGLADALAGIFADLPGEAAVLRDEVRRISGRAEGQALDDRLRPLRDVLAGLGFQLGPLRAALEKAQFGPGSTGPAGPLWAAFDAAATACHPSEAPWGLLGPLQTGLGGEHNPEGAAAALSLYRGMIARAEAAGLTELATRLRTRLRGLERAAARWQFEALKRGAKSSWSPGNGPSHVLGAGRALLLLTDDPDERAVLDADLRGTERRIRRGRVMYGALAVLAASCLLAYFADQSYSANPPYRNVAAQPLRPLAQPSGGAAQPSGGAAQPSGVAAQPSQTAAAGAVAATSPGPMAPAPTPTPTPEYLPKAPEPAAVPTPVPARSVTFPTLATLPERQPRDDGQVRTLAEVRWCAFNDLRLQAAVAGNPAEAAVQRSMDAAWRELCLSYAARRQDENQVKADAARNRTRLLEQGRTMLKAP